MKETETGEGMPTQLAVRVELSVLWEDSFFFYKH